MNGRFPARVLWGTLAWHPAVAAWRALAGDGPDPERVEVLHQGAASASYRLVGAGPGGRAIIARRLRLAQALIERTVYSRILRRLPLAAPRYCGFKAERAGFAWVFLEDAETVRA